MRKREEDNDPETGFEIGEEKSEGSNRSLCPAKHRVHEPDAVHGEYREGSSEESE
ncbi:hypothetical protein ACFQH8_15055 [Halomicroarcula sp. GCM10025710]